MTIQDGLVKTACLSEVENILSFCVYAFLWYVTKLSGSSLATRCCFDPCALWVLATADLFGHEGAWRRLCHADPNGLSNISFALG